jgi:hypothetical protein
MDPLAEEAEWRLVLLVAADTSPISGGSWKLAGIILLDVVEPELMTGTDGYVFVEAMRGMVFVESGTVLTLTDVSQSIDFILRCRLAFKGASGEGGRSIGVLSTTCWLGCAQGGALRV